jgi:Holliday junction DNA helicase RuvB
MGRGPYKVHDFVGQKRALAPALRLQDGAAARGEPAPHMLFTGPSGTGKSLAAMTLARRAGTEVTKFLGKATAAEIAPELARAKPCDIHFFDECHGLENDAQELLMDVIDSGHVPGKLVPGADPAGRVEIPPVTFILATDRPGKLLNPLLKRIPLPVRFKPYPADEMKEIVARIGDRRGVLLSPQAARGLARVCHGLPRRAEHHVNNLRLTFADSERRQLGLDDVRTYLGEVGLDGDGLDELAREYVRFLRRNTSASAEALAGNLGTDVEYLKSQVEQPLRFRGLVAVGGRGRVLTEKGKEWAAEALKKRKKGGGRG